MTASRNASTGNQTLRAMLNPAAIVLAALTVGAAFISPLLAIPGAVAWALTVYFLGRGRAAGRRVARVDIKSLPPTVQRDLASVREALDQIRQAARSAPRDQRVLLADVVREAEDVEQAVERMALAAGSLHDSLAETADKTAQSRLEALDAQAGAAADEAGRRKLQSEAEALRAQLAERERLTGTLERYRTTMQGLAASVQKLRGSITMLAAGQALDYDAVDSPVRQMDEMKASVEALEEVMASSVIMQQ